MGELAYRREVANRVTLLIAHFDELEQHQEKPISIGSVGAGKVVITHVMGLWLPWVHHVSDGPMAAIGSRY